MTRARILFVVPRFHTNLSQAVRILVERGFGVGIFATVGTRGEDHRFVVPQVFDGEEDRGRVSQALKEFSPDLILLRKAPLLSQHVAQAAGYGRYNVVSYDLRPLDKPRPASRLLAHWLAGRPVRRVTPVPGAGGRPDRWATLLPWPVETADSPPERRPGPLRVLCVAKLRQPRKNQLLLIEALRNALAAGRATLTLVGSSVELSEGPEGEAYFAKLKAAVREAGGDATIRPDVSYLDMADVYRAHDVCVLPSRDEPLGIAPLEAMGHGCVPLISTDCGSAGYVRDGENGRTFAPDDAETLRLQLEELAEDPPRLAHMSQQALETARTVLGPDRLVAGIEHLFRRG